MGNPCHSHETLDMVPGTCEGPVTGQQAPGDVLFDADRMMEELNPVTARSLQQSWSLSTLIQSHRTTSDVESGLPYV